MKGIEEATGLRLTQIVGEFISAPTAVWVGPGHVQDFLQGIPNCMVIDSQDDILKQRLVPLLSSELIRFYYGTDLIGSEVGAAAKNCGGHRRRDAGRAGSVQPKGCFDVQGNPGNRQAD